MGDIEHYEDQAKRLVARIEIDVRNKLIEELSALANWTESQPNPYEDQEEYWEGYLAGMWDTIVRIENI